jgi:hypothetical protein
MLVTGERQVTGGNGRNPPGQKGWITFGYGRFLLGDKCLNIDAVSKSLLIKFRGQSAIRQRLSGENKLYPQP